MLTITDCVSVQVYNFHTFIEFVVTGGIQIKVLSSNNYNFIGGLNIMASVTRAGYLHFWSSGILRWCGAEIQEVGIIIGISRQWLTSIFP